MLADVTNRARGARGLHLADGATRILEPGETARLDLAAHPAHRAWDAAGEVVIAEVKEDAAVGAPEARLSVSGVREKVGRRSRAG